MHELDALCRACIDDVQVDGGGVSLMTGQGFSGTAWVSDDLARHLEDLQFVLGEGPCVDAVSSGRPVLEPALAVNNGDALQRWPAFTPGAVEAGVQAIFGLPLMVGSTNLGAFDLFRRSPGPLTEQQFDHALAVAKAASTVLLKLEITESRVGPDTDAAYHWTVHQAAGMVSQQLRIDVDQALLKLRAAAYSEERSIDSLAADVVARRRRFTQEDT